MLTTHEVREKKRASIPGILFGSAHRRCCHRPVCSYCPKNFAIPISAEIVSTIIDEWKKNSWKWTRTETATVLMLATLFASFFHPFFADVICLFIALFSVGVYVIMQFKFNDENRFSSLMAYFIFLAAVVVAIRLHYSEIKSLMQAMLSYL